MSRCHSAIVDEFEDSKQRHAVCMSAWRKKKGGKPPKDSEQHMLSLFAVAQEIDLRREDLDGAEHVVLPMIGLVEGVYQCANCPDPNFYPASEFGKNVGSWNGRPVTIGHPMRDGSFVSAGSPDVWESERIGTVFNARLDGKTLHMEAWIDPVAVERASPPEAAEVMAAVEAGEQVEVSTAAWIDEAPRVGVHRSKMYRAVQTHFQPDHVALLPLGTIGACSWADGCGVRVAQACCDDCAHGHDCTCGVVLAHDEDEDDPPEDMESARSREMALQVALEEQLGGMVMVADHDDEHVYFVSDQAQGMRRRSYTLADDGACTLGEDEHRVRPRVEFIAVNQQEDGNMPAQKTEDTAAETQPSAAAANPPKPDPQKPPAPPPEPPPPTNSPKPQAAGLSSHDARMAELQAQVEHLTAKLNAHAAPTTEQEWLDRAPEGIRRSLMQLHQKEAKRKLELVDTIKTAPGCMWSEDDLKTKTVDELERLAALAARSDYSVQAPERSVLAPISDTDYAPIEPMTWDPPGRKAS